MAVWMMRKYRQGTLYKGNALRSDQHTALMIEQSTAAKHKYPMKEKTDSTKRTRLFENTPRESLGHLACMTFELSTISVRESCRVFYHFIEDYNYIQIYIHFVIHDQQTILAIVQNMY